MSRTTSEINVTITPTTAGRIADNIDAILERRKEARAKAAAQAQADSDRDGQPDTKHTNGG